MELPPTLLDLPASEGARRLALAYLETARSARAGVATAADPEALHDYRVALRRLRSCLRSYRRELRSTVTRKTRRRLDRIARATNRSRDLEVHLEWLASRLATADEAERPGIVWLADQLAEAQRRERTAMLALDERSFPDLYHRLQRQLLHYPMTVRLDEPAEPATTAVAAAEHIEGAARRLERRLLRVEAETSESEIHRARIAAKHLRYLLEPFAAVLPGGYAIIAHLKGLQDAFGDVHDAHVFLPTLRSAQAEAERNRRWDLGPGLRSLARSLRSRALEAFGLASREWRDPGRRGSFFEDVRAASRALTAPRLVPELARPPELAATASR